MKLLLAFSLLLLSTATLPKAMAKDCEGLPTHAQLKKALITARGQANGGFNLDMWGSVVDRNGTVCAVTFTGKDSGSQWPGSRLISAQKANTANAFSLPDLALSTANLYTPTQPGASLFGLQASNPLNQAVAYRGSAAAFGTVKDPLVGGRIGGVNVFGGGLALYNSKGVLLGAIGVSGDSSCADHAIAWRTRAALELDYVKAGVSSTKDDQIIYDVENGKSASGFGHVTCGGKEKEVLPTLPAVRRVSAK